MEKRMKRFEIRLSEDEYDRLKKNAQTRGSSIASLIRDTAIYGGKISPIIVDMKTLNQILFELRMQGNNLNQLAREANTFGMSNTLGCKIEENISQSVALRERLDEFLLDIRTGRF